MYYSLLFIFIILCAGAKGCTRGGRGLMAQERSAQDIIQGWKNDFDINVHFGLRKIGLGSGGAGKKNEGVTDQKAPWCCCLPQHPRAPIWNFPLRKMHRDAVQNCRLLQLLWYEEAVDPVSITIVANRILQRKRCKRYTKKYFETKNVTWPARYIDTHCSHRTRYQHFLKPKKNYLLFFRHFRIFVRH